MPIPEIQISTESPPNTELGVSTGRELSTPRTIIDRLNLYRNDWHGALAYHGVETKPDQDGRTKESSDEEVRLAHSLAASERN